MSRFHTPHPEKRLPSTAVGKKISILVGEGTPQKQAVATALSMSRAHRLTPAGGYIRAKKKPPKVPKTKMTY